MRRRPQGNQVPLDIICFSHLAWDRKHFQRPQQVMSRLAQRGHRVLYVKKIPFKDLRIQSRDLHLRQDESGVHLYDPIMPPSPVELSSWGRRPAEWQLRWRVSRVAKHLGMKDPILWNYHPDHAHTVSRMHERLAVYDCMDDHPVFMAGRNQVVENELRLLRLSGLVFAGGLKMRRDRLQHAPEILFFPCGVQTDHFARAYDERVDAPLRAQVPEDVQHLPRPILGFWGAVDYRVDWALVKAVAALHPEWSLLFLGPIVKMPERELRAILAAHPNIRWLGARPYDSLPDYARSFAACLMPWVEGGEAESINPTKTLEYLATGRPVISTRIRDVVEQYESPAIEFATGAEAFAEACARALAEDTAERRRARKELTAGKTWIAMVDGMEAHLLRKLDDQPVSGPSAHSANQESARA